MSDSYDLVFVGNAGLNEMHRFDGTTEPILGGPLFQSALATSWSDKRVAVVTRMAVADADLLEPLRKAGITVFVSPAPETTRSHIYYLSDDVDDRRHVLEKTAGPLSSADLPPLEARLFHLVGVNRIEFPLDFMKQLRDRGLAFSIDMQALVRNADPQTGAVTYEDYPHKQQVAAMAEPAPGSSTGSIPAWRLKARTPYRSIPRNCRCRLRTSCPRRTATTCPRRSIPRQRRCCGTRPRGTCAPAGTSSNSRPIWSTLRLLRSSPARSTSRHWRPPELGTSPGTASGFNLPAGRNTEAEE